MSSKNRNWDDAIRIVIWGCVLIALAVKVSYAQ